MHKQAHPGISVFPLIKISKLTLCSIVVALFIYSAYGLSSALSNREFYSFHASPNQFKEYYKSVGIILILSPLSLYCILSKKNLINLFFVVYLIVIGFFIFSDTPQSLERNSVAYQEYLEDKSEHNPYSEDAKFYKEIMQWSSLIILAIPLFVLMREAKKNLEGEEPETDISTIENTSTDASNEEGLSDKLLPTNKDS